MDAVGPEGGFTPDEISLFVEAGWRQASLGPRTLRTETAGIVAVALASTHGAIWAPVDSLAAGS